MPTYAEANRTKNYHQERLLHDHPEIVSIAPQLVFDSTGNLTADAVIVIGINKAMRPLITAAGAEQSIPTELPVIDESGVPTSDTIPVVIEDEGEVVAEVYASYQRPCPGGYSIGHINVTAGTLGGVARVNSTWEFILSNNHVLAASNTATLNDPIYQPGVSDGGTSGQIIGRLLRWVPIEFNGQPNEVDAALARAADPQYVQRDVMGIGIPARDVSASVGQHVRKSGRTTQLTYGRILSDNATTRVRYGVGHIATFVNQLQYTRMTQGGDSGSLIWDRDNLCVLGLHFAGSGTVSYGNKIRRVIELLSDPRTIYTAQGQSVVFDAINLALS